jgi:type II restriction enzyme
MLNKSLHAELVGLKEWKSNSRIYGEAVERWLCRNFSCPCCKTGKLRQLEINSPFIDLKCNECGESYQVKASSSTLVARSGKLKNLSGAAYSKSLEGLEERNKCNFLLVQYCRGAAEIKEAFLLRKEDISSEHLIKRKPLGPNARKAGLVLSRWEFGDINREIIL